MSKRERILAIAVGGMLLVVVMQWAFNKYRSAIEFRNNRIASLSDAQQRLQEQVLQGAYADRQMGEYLVRSLPSDPERARSDYQKWLLTMVGQHQIDGAMVDPTSSLPVGDLYHRLAFRVSGRTDLAGWVNWLYEFYAKDYLHRIREFSVSPTKDGDLNVEMTIDAIALSAAPADAEPPEELSWRVESSPLAYREPILNRNFFAPPNEAPSYDGSGNIEAIAGQKSDEALAFLDPDGDALRFEWAEQPPEFLELDPQTGTLQIDAPSTGEFPVSVRVTDDGYPNRSVEKQLVVKVSPPAEASMANFDDAQQTVLTALVQGREDWTAWMNVRTLGKTLKLQPGDEFEIGSLTGKVIEVTARHVLLEIDGRRFELKPAGNLAEAARRAYED